MRTQKKLIIVATAFAFLSCAGEAHGEKAAFSEKQIDYPSFQTWAQAVYDRAVAKSKAGNFKESERLGRLLLAAEPKDPDRLMFVADQLPPQAKLTEALNLYEMALSRSNSDDCTIHALCGISNLQTQLNMKGKARGSIRRLMKMKPRKKQVPHFVCLANLMNGKLQEPELLLDFCNFGLSVAVDPIERAELLMCRVNSYRLLNKRDLALKDLSQAAKYVSENDAARNARVALLYVDQNMPEVALRFFDRAFAHANRELRKGVLLSRANTYLTLSRKSECLRDLDTVMKEYGSEEGVLGAVAPMYTRLGKNEKALKAIDKMSSTSSGKSAVEAAKVMFLFKSRKFEEALTQADRALIVYPRNPKLIEVKAKILFEVGRKKEAIPYLAQAHELIPADDDILSLLANSRYSEGETAASLADYKELCRRQPHDVSFFVGLMGCYSRLNRLEEMKETADALYKIKDDMPDPVFAIMAATELHSKKMDDRARRFCDIAVKMFGDKKQTPDRLPLLLGLVTVLEGCGEKHKAVTIMEQVVTIDGSVPNRVGLARLCLDTGANQKALDAIEPLLYTRSHQNHRVELLNIKAKALRRLKRLDDATQVELEIDQLRRSGSEL